MATGQTQQAKKRLFLLKAGRACPLLLSELGESGFNAVVVFSFLVYRLKAAKGNSYRAAVSKKQIQRGTGLDRSRTIPAALQLLEKHDLIGTHKGRSFAYQPKDESWFLQMKHAAQKPWYARFAYFPIWIPAPVDNSLTPRQNALYWLIIQRPRQKQRYYSLCIGISDKTVRRTVEKLRNLHLLSEDDLTALRPAESHMYLWQDKAVRKSASTEYRLSRRGVFAKFENDAPYERFQGKRNNNGSFVSAYEQICEFVDLIGRKMQRAGYSRTEIETYWSETVNRILSEINLLVAIESLILEFPSIFEYVEAQTLRSRAAGRFQGANSLGLLKQCTKAAIDTLIASCDHYRRHGSVLHWSWQPPSDLT